MDNSLIVVLTHLVQIFLTVNVTNVGVSLNHKRFQLLVVMKEKNACVMDMFSMVPNSM